MTAFARPFPAFYLLRVPSHFCSKRELMTWISLHADADHTFERDRPTCLVEKTLTLHFSPLWISLPCCITYKTKPCHHHNYAAPCLPCLLHSQDRQNTSSMTRQRIFTATPGDPILFVPSSRLTPPSRKHEIPLFFWKKLTVLHQRILPFGEDVADGWSAGLVTPRSQP